MRTMTRRRSPAICGVATHSCVLAESYSATIIPAESRALSRRSTDLPLRLVCISVRHRKSGRFANQHERRGLTLAAWSTPTHRLKSAHAFPGLRLNLSKRRTDYEPGFEKPHG